MRTLYLDCGMGAAGDMLAAALLELVPSPDAALDRLNAVGIPGVRYQKSTVTKCGILGTHLTVTANGVAEESLDHTHGHDNDHQHQHDHNHEHHHAHDHGNDHEHGSLGNIEHLVRDHLSLSQKIKDDVLSVYRLLAEAESHVHGVPVDDIHFHEVGTLDAVADITAVCLLMDLLAPEQVVVSPVHVGSGQVRCAHGILPVPAPATAFILQGVPIYGGKIKGELCTPTGAVLLKHFATRFGDMPVMTADAVGYGMGAKDFEAANCVRAFLGETKTDGDEIAELNCNLDDMTPEAVGYVQELLFDAGALDVYYIPVGMKKSRPGILLCCMCKVPDTERFANILLKNTTTLGVRMAQAKRFTLERRTETIETEYGKVRLKISSGSGVEKAKPEYEDVAAIAKKSGLTFAEVSSLALEAYHAKA